VTDKEITLSVDNQTDGQAKALWGLFRSLIKNMVVGVNEGYSKKLEINGVGYRATVSGDTLTLSVGYSHPVIYKLSAGIKAEVQANNIIISGIDKQLVGETAAQIRKIRKPEPYKGKGIKYSDEILRRKAGKTAGKTEK
jgi:large subunit ribosomal protein L6